LGKGLFEHGNSKNAGFLYVWRYYFIKLPDVKKTTSQLFVLTVFELLFAVPKIGYAYIGHNPLEVVPSEMTIRQPVKGAAAFSKTIKVLQLIADSEQPLTSAELVKIAQLPRPTMRRILKALIAEDMAELRPDKTYALGPRNIELARKAVDQNSLLSVVEPDLGRLSSEVQSSVFLGIPVGNEFIFIAGEKADAKVGVGSLSPVHACAIAKAYLAHLAPDRREQILASIEMPTITEHTPTSSEQLRAEFAQTAAAGYSFADQQFRLGEKWFGACILDAKKTPCGGIGFNMELSQTDPSRETQLVSALTQCRDRINQKLQLSNFERPTRSL